MLDAGPGTFVRLGEAHLDLRQLDIVLLTHLHVDHAAELPGIVKARAVVSRADIRFQVFGPGGDAPAVIYRVDYKGHSITFSGDIDANGHEALTKIADGSNLLVFNDPVLDPPDSPAALFSLHTAPAEIGRIAATAGVSGLLISHLSRDVDEAQEAVTRSIGCSFTGAVQFAEDGLRVGP